ncbi:complement C1q-like protein 4 [Saccostrea cucullata]|uniref:complement C1q-like protein 4 n=1 Tax=Saccostrea cuccullata TaxID=36930 RepID=UPI002ED2EBD2
MRCIIGIFVLYSLNLVAAEKSSPNSFVNNLKIYKNACREMGWEPKCEKKYVPGKGIPVAFHAKLTKAINRIRGNEIIKYDDVIANVGNGYSPSTGIFTAPIETYIFFQLDMTKNGAIAYISGIVDGKLLVYSAIHGQSAEYQSSTAHLVVPLKKGNKFWTASTSGHTPYIHLNNTHISGFKVSDA